MPEESFIEKKEESISIQIFSVSAAMVGVCLTVIGLLNINQTLKMIEDMADELIAVDAFLFLVACLISYMAIRTKDRKQRLALEKIADWSFLAALLLIVAACVMIALEFI